MISDDEMFHVAKHCDPFEKGLRHAREARYWTRHGDLRLALECAKLAKDAAPGAWTEWYKFFTYQVRRSLQAA